MKGIIYGGKFVSKSIGPALWLEVNLPLLICFTLYLRAMFQVQAPGGLYEFWRGDLTEGFLSYRFRGLYSLRGLFSEFYGILQNNATLSPMKNLLFLFYSIFFFLCVTIPNWFSYIT